MFKGAEIWNSFGTGPVFWLPDGDIWDGREDTDVQYDDDDDDEEDAAFVLAFEGIVVSGP